MKLIETKNVYKYTLTSNYSCPFYDTSTCYRNEWVLINRGVITIKSGYSWDGCTPKIRVCGILIGTPDGRKEQCCFPSLIHDCLYQFNIGKRIDADNIFKKMLIEVNWKYYKLYYKAVRIFGRFLW